MRSRSRGAMRPRLDRSSRPMRTQGRPGARRTRGLVCNVHEEVRTRAYRFSGEHPAFPAQWFDGLWRALPLEPTPHTSVNGSWLRGENYCHAVTLCVYFNNFVRIQKTLAVASAIAAGIADKVLHEVGCAALMNANQAPALADLTRSRLPKSKFQTEALSNFEIGKEQDCP